MTVLTDTAETVLKRRYYLENENWETLCYRVAKAVASIEPEENREKFQQDFFKIIYNLDFLPNSPCLMNAGTELGQLSACFVLPVEDSLDGIFTAVRNGALVNKTGGGTGYSFSRLRPTDSTVCSTNGVASGPISFMKVFDVATDVIKQGGRRRGANMGVLDCTHPNIKEFITVKQDLTALTNFNLSVALTDDFMQAVKDDTCYDLIDPTTAKPIQQVNAREVFNLIIDNAWETGEPGVFFIDTANKSNPTPWLGRILGTNPCGEIPLLAYEACVLGSINLGNFTIPDYSHGTLKVDWERLQQVIRLATRFLDNTIDVSKYPIPEITEMVRKTRKLGLGIMGLHDLLIKLGVPYASVRGRELASEVMTFIRTIAEDESKLLAGDKGCCPAFDDFIEELSLPIIRNATLTSIQPTGTVSMIANCSSGCEPYFALVNRKNVMDNDSFLMVNPLFEGVARKEGWYSLDLMNRVATRGTVVDDPEVPKHWQEVFRCAQDISVDDHILMQAALQNNGVDAAISKTINMPSTATKEDVKRAYLYGWELGCKGLTVYRDGSRTSQVLTVGSKSQGGENTTSPIPCSGKLELPDVLESRRYRLKDKDGGSIYVIVCFVDGGYPVEVFAKFPADNRVEQYEQSTMWATICRLVSLSLRCGVPIEEVIKQLDRASGSMFDLPAQLSKLFKGFMEKIGGGYCGGTCPDCGGTLQYQEGCMLCSTCGYSKCS